MLAKAHIVVGMAAAYSIMRPETAQDAMPVVAGAAIGCLICDLDCENKTERTQASHWRIVTWAIAAVALLEDYLIGKEGQTGMCHELATSGSYAWCIGVVGFVLTCMFACISSHRGFSHSIIALILEAGAIWFIFPAMVLPFSIAFLSHVVLDLTNKKSVRLLYPSDRGFCLKWFYADRTANRFCEFAGAIWLAGAIFISHLAH